ncbi:hypothetical protein J2S46_001126 [Kitasatospora herbaricolor]|nr:hypothetical protein [Kitasatospora herbaricolor]
MAPGPPDLVGVAGCGVREAGVIGRCDGRDRRGCAVDRSVRPRRSTGEPSGQHEP